MKIRKPLAALLATATMAALAATSITPEFLRTFGFRP